MLFPLTTEQLAVVIADKMLDYGADVIGTDGVSQKFLAYLCKVPEKEIEESGSWAWKEEYHDRYFQMQKACKLLKSESLLSSVPKEHIRIVHTFGLRCEKFSDLRKIGEFILKEGLVPQAKGSGKHSELPSAVFAQIDYPVGELTDQRFYNKHYPWITADIPYSEFPYPSEIKHYRSGDILTLNYVSLDCIVAMNGLPIEMWNKTTDLVSNSSKAKGARRTRLKQNPAPGYRWTEGEGRVGPIYCQGNEIYGKIYPAGVVQSEDRFNAVVIELDRSANYWKEVNIGWYRTLDRAKYAIENRVHGYIEF